MRQLDVLLGERFVGRLERVSAPDTWRFEFDQDYIQLFDRPVLGQFFEDDLDRTFQATSQLPPFFSNLLPEGAFRDLVARKAGVHKSREAHLLAILGEDLSGAVTVRPEGGFDGTDSIPAEQDSEHGAQLKFSLAGVQLKFSAIRRASGGMTIPAHGMGGDWIVKLPDQTWRGVPENEYSMLEWAATSAIDVPDRELVALDAIDGLPPEVGELTGQALAIRRYDREGGQRIHQEDFAQVLNVYPADKYDASNHETIGRILLALCPPEDFRAYVKRLVFMLCCGNGDMHLKNWSLVYPDGVQARLAPAYDYVFTRGYLPDDRLGLNLGGGKDYPRLDAATFRRFATQVEQDPEQVAEWVREDSAEIREVWKRIGHDLPLEARLRPRLDEHLEAVARRLSR